MRRPGFLGETTYWFGTTSRFGNDCWVCEGKKCKNVCSTAMQKKKLKERFAKESKVAAKSGIRKITSNTQITKFALKAGESQKARFKRLQAIGLYIPGGKMTINYGNLVNFGTTNKAIIAKIKRQKAEWQRQQNIKRYGTTDMKKILWIVKRNKQIRDAMWLKVYGTKNADKIYAMNATRRKQLCDANAECVRIRKKAQR